MPSAPAQSKRPGALAGVVAVQFVAVLATLLLVNSPAEAAIDWWIDAVHSTRP